MSYWQSTGLNIIATLGFLFAAGMMLFRNTESAFNLIVVGIYAVIPAILCLAWISTKTTRSMSNRSLRIVLQVLPSFVVGGVGGIFALKQTSPRALLDCLAPGAVPSSAQIVKHEIIWGTFRRIREFYVFRVSPSDVTTLLQKRMYRDMHWTYDPRKTRYENVLTAPDSRLVSAPKKFRRHLGDTPTPTTWLLAESENPFRVYMIALTSDDGLLLGICVNDD